MPEGGPPARKRNPVEEMGFRNDCYLHFGIRFQMLRQKHSILFLALFLGASLLMGERYGIFESVFHARPFQS